MAIDKIKLRALAKDKDERLFEEGDMLDALNIVTSTSDGDDGGVVKNVKGTLPGREFSAADEVPSEKGRVIGSVSDDSRGHVYFFVWSTTQANHAIYQYDSKTNLYRVVLRNAVLDFEEYGFVNADLINGEFETDSTKQTILYFTDNVNPPRKINVDRALDTDLGSYSDEEISEMISVIKTPSLFAPEVSLTTDTNRTTNNLYGTVFQFATQYIYKDGEASAISPHSKVVYPKYMSIQGINSSEVTQEDIREENLAVVNTRWTDTPVDLSVHKREVHKLKLLVRTLNTGFWKLVDEFDPNENVNRNGSVIYNSESGFYNFYNDGLYTSEPVSSTDKVYDDVPHKSSSQAIVGNRLMYASPTSGYPNVDASATFSVTYLPEANVELINDETSEDTVEHAQEVNANFTKHGWIRIDTTGFPSTIESNSEVSLSFRYKPTSFVQWGNYDPGTGSAQDLPLLRVTVSDEDGNQTPFYCGEIDDSAGIGPSYNSSSMDGGVQVATDPDSLQFRQLTASIVVTESLSKSEYMSLIIDEIKQQVLSYEFRGLNSSDLITWKLRSLESGGGDITHTLTTRKLDFDVAFTTCTYDSSSDTLTLEPRSGNFFIPYGPLQDDASAGLSLTAEHVKIVPVSNPLVALEGSLSAVSSFFYQANSSFLQPRSLNGIFLGYVLDWWDDYILAPDQQNGALDLAMSILPLSIRRTFKAGSTHEFGVVYFDKHGRPGFVNKLGSVYVHPFGDVSARSDGATPTPSYYNGPCNINVTMTSDPPEWAVAYQIVYAGSGSWEKFESYTVGGAFSRVEDDVIYLSLNTLSAFQKEKGALKDYSYTAGDKLRIINYMDHPSAGSIPTDKVYLDDEYIFDVVGYETYVNDQEWEDHASGSDHSNHKGKFLLLSNVGGTNYEDANFDNSADNYWSHQVLVEILTPRKNVEDKVYYEVGEARRIFKDDELSNSSNNPHNDGNAIVLTEGDVYYRPCALKAPNYESSSPHDFVKDSLIDWVYISRNIESSSASDFFDSKCWSKGRAHVPYERAATINFYNRISYSEEMGDDIGGLTFSSFNPGASSYKNLPKRYGSINHICNYNQSVAALQENKLSYIPVKRNVIEYADGASNITVNQDVMGQHKESNGDFGCGNDQSAVLLRDGILFFVDRSRQKVLAAAGGQLKTISDVEMSSFFEDEFDRLALAEGDGGRIISGFDPMENMYYVTIEDKESTSNPYTGVTVGYSLPDKRWISKYSFKPTNYASIDNKMLSCKYSFNGDPVEYYLFHHHTGTGSNEYNTFYESTYPSSVKVVSKISPSNVKVFNAISYEGSLIEGTANHGLWQVPTQGIYSSYEGYTGPIEAESFRAKEGAYYAPIPRSVFNSGHQSSENIMIGNLTHVSGGEYTSNINLRRIPIPINTQIQVTGSNIPAVTTIVTSVNGNTITFDDTSGDFDTTNDVYIVTDPAVNGNSIRGHWCTIRMNLPSDDATLRERELYCINVHLTDSKLHHPKGQQ